MRFFKLHWVLVALLILLISLSGVVASDLNDVNITEVDDTLKMEDDSLIAQADEIEVENWDELQYYSSLNDKNYVLKLKENTNYYPTDVDSEDSKIIFNNNVTIIGTPTSYIGDSSPNARCISYRAMEVPDESGIGITLKGVTFKWIYSSYQSDGVFCVLGGNTYNYIEDCNFYNITTEIGHSSIVQIKSGDAMLDNCTFINCTNGYGCLSVYNPKDDPTKLCTRARMSVSNSYFEGNYATTEPGCINNCGVLVVSNSTFRKNSAFWWAGAIHTHGGANTTIYDSNFTENVAGWNGGALFTYSYLQVYRTIFNGNNCTTDYGGGAIGAYNYQFTAHIHIEDSIFRDNANNCWGADSLSSGPGRGGAIAIYSGDINVTNTTFIRNSASKGTGIFGSNLDSATIRNCSFINHTRVGDVLVFSNPSSLDISDNYYYHNSFEFKKLRLLSDEKVGDTVTIHIDADLKNPNAFESDILDTCDYDVYVNGVYNKTVTGRTFTLTLKDGETCNVSVAPCISISKTKDILVGIPKEYIYVSQSSGSDSNSGLTRSSPVRTIAKAIELARTKGNILIMDGSFSESNLTVDYKLAIVGEKNVHFTGDIPLASQTIFTVTNTDLRLTNIIFDNIKFNADTKNKDKRIIKLTGGYLTIENCVFNKNYVVGNSYMVLIESSSVEVYNSQFMNHNACPIAAIKSNDFLVDNCSFRNNSAHYSLANSGDSLITTAGKNSGLRGTVTESIFENNKVKNGCIYFGATANTLTISNTKFISNYVSSKNDLASCIYVENSPVVNIESSLFINNVNLGSKGAVIYSQGATSSISVLSSIILNNSYANSKHHVFSASGSESVYADLNGNWWGNTLENLTAEPPVYNESCRNWLVLNITSNATELGLDQKALVTFDFYSTYDANGNISFFDASEFPEFDLKIRADNGISNVDKVTVVSGRAQAEFTLKSLSGGSLTASYCGVESTINFTWTLIDPVVEITAQNVTYGETAEIVLNVPSDMDVSKATLTVNNATYNIENVISIPNLNAGNYLVNFTFEGDLKYNPYNLTKTFSVKKANPQLSISADDIYVGGVVKITIAGDSKLTGKISVNVGNITKNVTMTNGIARLNLSGLKANTYNVTLRFAGNANFLSQNAKGNFTVRKYSSFITISKGNVELGRDVDLTFKVNDDAIGNVTLTINTETYSLTLSNAQANYTIKSIKRGIYNVRAIYNGDERYLSSENSIQFDIGRENTTMAISAADITYGEDASISVTLKNDATGNVTAVVDGKNKTSQVKNGKAIINISDLAAGLKTVKVSYSGDNKYLPMQKSGQFNVLKAEVMVNVEVSDIMEGQVAHVKVTFDKKVTGTIILDYAGKTENINIPPTRVISRQVEGLGAGNYTVSAKYSGDANYLNASSKIKTFKVISWANPQWPNEGYDNKNTEKSPYSSDSNGNVAWIRDISSEITGNMAIDSQGNIYITVADGIFSFDGNGNARWNFTSHDAGDSFSGMAIYRDVVLAPKSMDKLYFINQTTGEKYANNIYQGSSLFAPIVDENATIYIAGEYQYSSSKYNLVVIAYRQWQSSTEPVLIDIGQNKPVTAPVLINENTVAVGCEKSVLIVDLQSGSIIANPAVSCSSNLIVGPGNIVYTISKGYVVAISPDGSYSQTKISKNPGNYLSLGINGEVYSINKKGVLCEYSTGDEILIYDFGEAISSRLLVGSDGVLYAGSQSGTFYAIDNAGNPLWKVKLNQSITGIPVMDENGVIYLISGNSIVALNSAPLKDSNLNATIKDVNYGEKVTISVDLNSEATGSVSVQVGDVYFDEVIIKNGKVSFVISDLDAGNYTAQIDYGGDLRFKSKSLSQNFEVKKITPTIEITAKDIYCNENLNVKVKLSLKINDEVVVSIGDDSQFVSLKNGAGQVVFSDLTVGVKTIEVEYAGSENYNPSSVSKEITVSKMNTAISIAADDISYGEILDVNVNLTGHAGGKVNISLGSLYQIADVNDGMAFASFENLNAGTYTIRANYLGDASFNPVSAISNVSVSKINPDLSIVAGDIDYGETLNVQITLNAKATGYVNVSLGSVSKRVKISNGFAFLSFDNLNAGKKTIVVNYLGDNNFKTSSISKDVTVNKIDANMTASVHDILIGADEIISVELARDATGNVDVNVNGVSYSLAINDGKASLTIENLENGHYTVKFTYGGDVNYLKSNLTREFFVSEKELDFDVSAEDIDYGETLIIKVSNLPIDALGNISTEINGITYYASKNTGGNAAITISGLIPGNYTVNVTYLGDLKYLKHFESVEFKVNKVTPDFNVSSSVSDDGLVVISSELPADASGNVSLLIGENAFVCEVMNGKAEISISDLLAGNYTVDVTYSGDLKYFKSTKSVEFKVNKVTPDIGVSCEVSGVDSVNITVELPVDASGIIMIDVNGNSYNVTCDVACLVLDNLDAGDYSVGVTYLGDGKYNSVSGSSSFTISKRAVDFDVSVQDIEFGDVAFVNVSGLPSDASGNVSLVIAGNTYSSEVIDGKAIISIPDLLPGNYVVNVSYCGDSKYLNLSKSAEFAVSKVNPKINISVSLPDSSSAHISVKLPSDAGGLVMVKVNDEVFNLKVGEDLELNALSGGKYDVNAIYLGDEKYDVASVSDSFEISKKVIKTFISVDSSFTRVATDYGAGERGAVFNAVLLDEDGNPLANKTVWIVINGPIYNVTTDSEGRAGLAVNLASANTYTYALFFQGDDTYCASHLASSKLIVTKKPTSIKASNKKFKASVKTKTVTVTLRTSKNPYDGKTYLKKGKIISIKLNGKTYSEKTDKKGVAKFNIKLTKKGKFTCKISFEGDNTYEASSKSIKITIS